MSGRNGRAYAPVDSYSEYEQRSAPSIAFRSLADIVAEQREPRWLIPKILERQVLAVLAGPRGTFKSFIALHWALSAAVDDHPVAILSAEGAGLDRRVDAWMRTFGGQLKLADLPAIAYERPLQLNHSETMQALQNAIVASGVTPSLIVVDTLSKYSAGTDESSNTEMAAFLSQLVAGLRDRFESTVLVVTHTGHQDAKRPRGAYAIMANADAEYIVERPSAAAMTVTVSRDRFKDIATMPPLAYAAEAIDLARKDSCGDPVTSLILRGTDAPPRVTKATGANQKRVLTALTEWANANSSQEILTSDVATALLKRHSIGRQRKPEVMKWLVEVGVLVPSLGGHRIVRDAL
jgi:hypothetical protein